MTTAYVGYAITVFPIIRKYKEIMALEFLSFRIIASVLNSIGYICLLLLLSLSQEFVKDGTPGSSCFQTFGDLLRSGHNFVNHVAMILATSTGSLMFYFLLYQAKLVPRWLSFWDLIGTLFTLLASFHIMFHKIDIINSLHSIQSSINFT
jgi:hypothetical protein